MPCVDFNDYAESYEGLIAKRARFFSKDHRSFSASKVSLAREILGDTPRSILDYGCGTGGNLATLCEMFPGSRISATDVSEKCLHIAKERHPSVRFFLSGKESVPEKFELVFVSNVMHHVEPRHRTTVLDSIAKFLGAESRLLIYEHNPYNPVARRIVSTCPIDRGASLIRPTEMKGLLKRSGLVPLRLKYYLFIPFFRHVSFFKKGMKSLENCLGRVPFGGQYLIEARRDVA